MAVDAFGNGPLGNPRLMGKVGRAHTQGLDRLTQTGGELLIHSLANIILTIYSIRNIQYEKMQVKAIFLPILSMHWVKIKIRMLEQGIYTQKALAEKLGVNPSTVTRLFKGQRKSRRLEKQIAEILGVSLAENKTGEK